MSMTPDSASLSAVGAGIYDIAAWTGQRVDAVGTAVSDAVTWAGDRVEDQQKAGNKALDTMTTGMADATKSVAEGVGDAARETGKGAKWSMGIGTALGALGAIALGGYALSKL